MCYGWGGLEYFLIRAVFVVLVVAIVLLLARFGAPKLGLKPEVMALITTIIKWIVVAFLVVGLIIVLFWAGGCLFYSPGLR